MRRVVSCCILAFLLLAVAGGAGAVEVSIWPVAELDEIYDNNVDLTPTNRKGDWVTSETFGATLEASTATRNVYLTYQTYLLEYAAYGGHDRFGNNHFANLRDDEQLSKNTRLSISENLLIGNAISNGSLVNGATPIGTQLMQSLFYSSSNLNNSFAIDLFSKYSESFTWTANVHQNLFSTLSSSSSTSSSGSSNPNSGDFYNQGAAIGGQWDLPERFTGGFRYQFDDYRASNSQPTAETNWPQAQMTWGEGTPFLFRGQVGPTITSSSSGSLVTTNSMGALTTSTVSSKTQVQVGYIVRGDYRDRRLTISAYAAQQPGFGAGFSFATNQQSYGALINYKLTRRATIFANAAYYDQGASGVSEQGLSYTGGVTYRLNKYLIVSGNYLGFETKASSSAVLGGTFVGTPGKRTTVNLFQAGITFSPPPLKWRL